jgi:hypothetical protein
MNACPQGSKEWDEETLDFLDSGHHLHLGGYQPLQ